MSVFLDSSYIIALNHERDIMHKRAKGLEEEIDYFGTIYISDHVFGELLNYFLARQGIQKARKMGGEILGSGTEIITIGFELFQKSWEIFNERDHLSFTDCSTIAAMRNFGIKNLATFDSGFNQFKSEINVLPE